MSGSMIYLDTHVLVWLYAGETALFPKNARNLIEENELLISPAVLLELQYLKEIGRINAEPMLMFENLSGKIGLSCCEKPFMQIITEAMLITWTRDPFDRIITATAQSEMNKLLTKDRGILSNYPNAVWD